MAGGIRKRSWQTCKGEIRTAWVIDYFDQAHRRHTKQSTTKIELGYSSKWQRVTMGQENIALALGTIATYSVTRRRPREDGGVRDGRARSGG
jgi:hypothetical protein